MAVAPDAPLLLPERFRLRISGFQENTIEPDNHQNAKNANGGLLTGDADALCAPPSARIAPNVSLSSPHIASDAGMLSLPTAAMLKRKALLSLMVQPLTLSALFLIFCSTTCLYNDVRRLPCAVQAIVRFVVGSHHVRNLPLHNGTIATPGTSHSKATSQLDTHNSTACSNTDKRFWPQLKQIGRRQLPPRHYAPAFMPCDPPPRIALKHCA